MIREEERQTVKRGKTGIFFAGWLTAFVLAALLLAAEGPGAYFRKGIAGDLTEAVYRQYMPMALGGALRPGSGLLPIMEYARETEKKPAEQKAPRVTQIEIPSEWEIPETGTEDTQGNAFPREELPREEDPAADGKREEERGEAAFVPREKQAELDWKKLAEYEELLKQFYTIDANTMAGSDQLNADRLSKIDLRIDRQTKGPQILIYHTHSMEGYADSTPGDSATSVMGVGERLAQILTERYGYQVLHHTGQYDRETRDDAYSKALPVLQQILQENPSLQVVIDLHRDEMPEKTRLVTDVDGRPTARFMFFNGLSRTRKTGSLDYLRNEYQEENLAFSFQMKQKAEEYYPGLTRKIYLKGYRYNMHLCPRTLLIELGAQNNTVEEAMNACDPLAQLLDMVLSGG